MGREAWVHFNLWTRCTAPRFNIYVVCVCYFITHTWAHADTRVCGTWCMVSAFLTVSEKAAAWCIKDWFRQWSGESVFTQFSVFSGSRLLSFIPLKTYTLLYGFRDTTSDLHLAEHKWVKRKYNTEQSPLLTPPGAYSLLQSAPALFMPLNVSSTSPTRLAVYSNGVGHQALFKMGGKKKKRETSIDLKMSCSVIFKSFHLWLFFFFLWGPRDMVGKFIE